MYSSCPGFYNNRWYSHEPQLNESRIDSRHILGENGSDLERTHPFSNWNKFDLCSYPTNVERNSDPSEIQFPPPVSSVCNLCDTRTSGLRDVNANIELQQNFNHSIDSREAEYASNIFCSGISNNPGYNNGGNLNTDQGRENPWSNCGDCFEMDDGNSVQIIDEIWYSPREVLSTPVVSSQSMPDSCLPENPKYVSVIRHTNALGKSGYKAPNSNIIVNELPCTEPMDCNNNSDNTVEAPKNQDQKKPTLLALKGKIINVNYLKGLQNSEVLHQKFSLFHAPNNVNISENCVIIKSHHIRKTENTIKSKPFPLVLAFPFYTFQISIDIYFLFLNICTHFHIFFNSMRSCLTYLSVISKLSHFLLEQKTKPTEVCFTGRSEEKAVESGKPGCFPLDISSILPDNQFLKSRELLTDTDVLYFRKSQNESFIPLKICGVSPCTLKGSVVDKTRIPKTLQASNGCTIPVVLFKQQVCTRFSEIEHEEILLEIIQSLNTHHLFKNSVKDLLTEQNVSYSKESRIGDSDSVNYKRGKPREKANRKIGMYIVKPMSIRRAHFSKNHNLFSVRPAWVDSDLKLYFEKLSFDNENFLNKGNKHGFFEIKPITNCTDNISQVLAEPYKVKYLMPDERIKILLIKEQTTKASRKSRNKIDDITNHNSSLVKIFDNLSHMDKKNTLLLMKNDNGYENVGQEPIQIILQKLGIQGYPFLIDETLEHSSEPVLETLKSSFSNPAYNQQVQPMASICQDIETVLNSSESISLLDTCHKLADTYRKHENTEKQKFGCMRKIFSGFEEKELQKEMHGKGNTCFNVYEAVRKYLNVNCKGIGEFKNCIEFRHARGVRSPVAEANFVRSDDNLFLFYDMLMSDGQSMISLQVLINRRLPNEQQCVNSVGVHIVSGKENCVIDQSSSFKSQKEQILPSKRHTSEELKLEVELAMKHGESPAHNLLLQISDAKTGAQEELLCHAVEDKPLDYLRPGSNLSEMKAPEKDSMSSQLISETQITPFAANEILQTKRHITKRNIGSSDVGKDPDIKKHSAAKAYNIELNNKMSVDFSNFSQSKFPHFLFRDRSYSPPSKKTRNTYRDRKNHKLLKTISIEQYIERNPSRDNEGVEASNRSENLSLITKNDFVHPSSHIADHSRKLGKTKAYDRNEQSIRFQCSAEFKNRKLLYSPHYHLERCDVCLRHQTSSHFSQCSPSFEIINSHQRNRKRRCSESDSLQFDHDHWQHLELDESLIGGGICKHCEKSFNRHSYRDGVYKCPKIRKSSIKMCHGHSWKKSCNMTRLSSDHGLVKQNNCKTHTDCTVKERNNVRIYTDPECFKNIVASTLTREDEDALKKVVSERDIFLYSPERKRITQDPRFRKRTLVMEPVESNDYEKEITGSINTKFHTKSDVPCLTECDLKAFTEYSEKKVKDTSPKLVPPLIKNAMKFNEKCLNFLKAQAQYFSANPGTELNHLPFLNLNKKNENKKVFNLKNCGNGQLDLTDSNPALGAQAAPSQGPGRQTSTVTPTATMMLSYHRNESCNHLPKVSCGNEPYSPSSPTSTYSNPNFENEIT